MKFGGWGWGGAGDTIQPVTMIRKRQDQDSIEITKRKTELQFMSVGCIIKQKSFTRTKQTKTQPFWKTKSETTNKTIGIFNSLKQLLQAETPLKGQRTKRGWADLGPDNAIMSSCHRLMPTVPRGKILARPTTLFFPTWLLCMCMCVCMCICACVGVCVCLWVCVHSLDHRESSEDFERESGSSTNRHVVGEQLEEERLGVGLGASLRRRMPSYETVVTCAAT